MDYETRQRLRHEISAIQREKEERARRMHVKLADGSRMYLGGGARSQEEQIRSGYPHWEDQAEGKRRNVKETKYLCGCDYKEKRIQEYGVTVHSDGSMTKKRYDREGFEVCPIHGKRLVGWYSELERNPKPQPRTNRPLGTPGVADRRDLRDPAELGQAHLDRDAAGNGRVETMEHGRTAIGIAETGKTPPRPTAPLDGH